MAPTPSDEVEAALLRERTQNRLEDLEELTRALDKQLAEIKGERDKALRWGIIALGTAVLGMAGWIFNLITTGHLK